MSGPHDVPGEHPAGGPDATHGPEGDAGVGSVAEEAAKLFGALAGLAREHAPGLGEGLAGLADHVEGADRAGHADQAEQAQESGGERGARASAECAWCPVCRTVHLVRQTSPEVRAHLASAVTSLARAAAGLLATAVPDDAAARRSGFEHIDLDEDPEQDDRDTYDENHDENDDGGPR